ncbi:MAG TPA: hypothetical protein VNW92_11375, partial [Polyangiaceae bacterium]|nr:hypothetical protein [Polyangiaceae bacterium]
MSALIDFGSKFARWKGREDELARLIEAGPTETHAAATSETHTESEPETVTEPAHTPELVAEAAPAPEPAHT